MDIDQFTSSAIDELVAEEEKVSVSVDICEAIQAGCDECIDSTTDNVEWEIHSLAIQEEIIKTVSETEISFIHDFFDQFSCEVFIKKVLFSLRVREE